MSKVTPIKQKSEDILERPINVLDNSLAQTHAIADLIFTWESLCQRRRR